MSRKIEHFQKPLGICDKSLAQPSVKLNRTVDNILEEGISMTNKVID
jgi:hypothetical protein